MKRWQKHKSRVQCWRKRDSKTRIAISCAGRPQKTYLAFVFWRQFEFVLFYFCDFNTYFRVYLLFPHNQELKRVYDLLKLHCDRVRISATPLVSVNCINRCLSNYKVPSFKFLPSHTLEAYQLGIAKEYEEMFTK